MNIIGCWSINLLLEKRNNGTALKFRWLKFSLYFFNVHRSVSKGVYS